MDMEDFWAIHRLLTLKFKIKSIGEEGYVTNAYVPQSPNLKRIFLDEIIYLGSKLQNQIWILGGDFNMIKNLLENRKYLKAQP
jgi:hypothetical protein